MNGLRPVNVIGLGLLVLIALAIAIAMIGKFRFAEERANRENERMPRSMGIDPTLPDWFRNMDKNSDGKLSRAEFLGTEEQFRRFDTNRDGFIDANEARAADAEFRNAVPE